MRKGVTLEGTCMPLLRHQQLNLMLDIFMQKDFSEELKKECAAIKKSADLNKAAASLKLHNYRDAIAAASKVMATQQLFRKT